MWYRGMLKTDMRFGSDPHREQLKLLVDLTKEKIRRAGRNGWGQLKMVRNVSCNQRHTVQSVGRASWTQNIRRLLQGVFLEVWRHNQPFFMKDQCRTTSGYHKPEAYSEGPLLSNHLCPLLCSSCLVDLCNCTANSVTQSLYRTLASGMGKEERAAILSWTVHF